MKLLHSTLNQKMANPRTLKIWRFVAVAFCATLAAFGLTFLVFSFPDTRPPTHFESICTWVWAAFSWPLVLSSFFCKEDSLIVYILSWIVSGLFWAFIVKLLFKVKAKTGKISNQDK
jgi:hypothetical protein